MNAFSNAMTSGQSPSTGSVRIFGVVGSPIPEHKLKFMETIGQYAAYLYDAIDGLNAQIQSSEGERYVSLAKIDLECSGLAVL